MDTQQLQILKNRYDIVGNSHDLNTALEVATAVAPTDLTVLVYGESGVGKENIPKIIHQNSRRRGGRYFAVNCGAIPEGTVDSELFGHEKGAFTGAIDTRKGYFEEADGGTLFLDEIAELPMASQAKLLRVLQDGEFIRVGSSKVLKTDVRVIAATNVDLKYAVQKGKFRADLYYRLSAIIVKMPALRERPEDIPLLFRKFASDFSEKYGTNKVNLSPDANHLLCTYRWPGNVRQLKNIAETVSALESTRMTSRTERCEITAEVLSAYIPKDEHSVPSLSVNEEGMSASEKEMIVRMLYQLRQEVDYLRSKVDGEKHMQPAVPPSLPPAAIRNAGQFSGSAQQPEEEAEWQEAEVVGRESVRTDLTVTKDIAITEREVKSIEDMKQEMVEEALKRNNGNRRTTANELGISERTLYRRLRKSDEK